MKFLLYVLKDEDSNEYGKITMFENESQAVRFYCQFINQNKLNNIAKKFVLKLVGNYDSSNGKIRDLDSLNDLDIKLNITSNDVDLENMCLISAVNLQEVKENGKSSSV